MLQKAKSTTRKDLAETKYDDKGLRRQIYTRGGESREGRVEMGERRGRYFT